MTKLIAVFVKLALLAFLINFGLSFHEKSEPIYLQNIIFWILIIIPCVISYESFLSYLIKKFTKEEKNTETKVKKTFEERIQEKADEKTKKDRGM